MLLLLLQLREWLGCCRLLMQLPLVGELQTAAAITSTVVASAIASVRGGGRHPARHTQQFLCSFMGVI